MRSLRSGMESLNIHCSKSKSAHEGHVSRVQVKHVSGPWVEKYKVALKRNSQVKNQCFKIPKEMCSTLVTEKLLGVHLHKSTFFFLLPNEALSCDLLVYSDSIWSCVAKRKKQTHDTHCLGEHQTARLPASVLHPLLCSARGKSRQVLCLCLPLAYLGRAGAATARQPTEQTSDLIPAALQPRQAGRASVQLASHSLTWGENTEEEEEAAMDHREGIKGIICSKYGPWCWKVEE